MSHANPIWASWSQRNFHTKRSSSIPVLKSGCLRPGMPNGKPKGGGWWCPIAAPGGHEPPLEVAMDLLEVVEVVEVTLVLLLLAMAAAAIAAMPAAKKWGWGRIKDMEAATEGIKGVGMANLAGKASSLLLEDKSCGNSSSSSAPESDSASISSSSSVKKSHKTTQKKS